MIERIEDLDILSASERGALLTRLTDFSKEMLRYLEDQHSGGEFDSRFQVDISQHRSTRCFHASATSYYLQCPRLAWYDLNGDPANQDASFDGPSLMNMNQGHAVHGMLQHLMHQMSDSGKYKVTQFEDELDMFIPELKLSGHMDGFLYLEDPVHGFIRLGVEIKTAAEAYWKEVDGKGKPMPGHISQAASYCNHFRLPIMLFMYFNKNNSKVRCVPWIHQPAEWDKIERLLTSIIRMPESPGRINNYKCNDCKHRTSCDSEPKARRA